MTEIDLFRVVALGGVLVIHGGAWLTDVNSPPGTDPIGALVQLARFSVPAFVFLSGLVLFHSYGHRPFAAPDFLKKRFTRALLPWFCWMPLFLALAIRRGEVRTDLASTFTWLLYGAGHLYFLVLIAQFYLLFLLMPKRRGLYVFAATALAAQVALMWWHSYGAPAPKPWAWAGYLAHEEAPFWVGYFALGAVFGSQLKRLLDWCRLWPLALLATVAAGAGSLWEAGKVPPSFWHEGSYSYLWPSRLPLTIAIALLTLWFGRYVNLARTPVWPVISSISRHTLGIYILHPVVLDLLGRPSAALPPGVRLLLLIVLPAAAAYLAVTLIVRSQLGALVLGETRARAAPPASSRQAPKPPGAGQDAGLLVLGGQRVAGPVEPPSAAPRLPRS